MIRPKIRKLRRYILKKDHAIDVILTTTAPNWYSWLQWLFPIVNASFLTPAILYGADQVSMGTYYLIGINAILLAWNLKHTLENLYFDTGNRLRYAIQLSIIVLAGLLGAGLALMTMPLVSADPSTFLVIFYVVNVASSIANFAASLSGMFIPWLMKHGQILIESVMGSGKRLLKLPRSISDKLNKNDEFYLTRHKCHNDEKNVNLFAKVLRNLGIGNDESSDKEILLSARKKATNFCYTYKKRNEEKVAGSFWRSKVIDTITDRTNEIVVDGKFNENSDGFRFFKGRVEWHGDKIVYDLKVLQEIMAPLKDDSNETLTEKVKTISKHVKIDYLYTVVEKLNKDKKIQLYTELNKNIHFKGKPQTLREQVHQMQEISQRLLEKRIRKKLIKFHDEEGFGVNEIRKYITNKLPNGFDEKYINKALALLQNVLEKRYANEIRPCPLEDQHGEGTCFTIKSHAGG